MADNEMMTGYLAGKSDAGNGMGMGCGMWPWMMGMGAGMGFGGMGWGGWGSLSCGVFGGGFLVLIQNTVYYFFTFKYSPNSFNKSICCFYIIIIPCLICL